MEVDEPSGIGMGLLLEDCFNRERFPRGDVLIARATTWTAATRLM